MSTSGSESAGDPPEERGGLKVEGFASIPDSVPSPTGLGISPGLPEEL